MSALLKEDQINLQGLSWIAGEKPLSIESLKALFANEIPLIRIKNFASKKECLEIMNVVQDYASFQGYSSLENANTILKFGPSQCEFASKADYFSRARKYEYFHEYLREKAFNPLDRLINMLKRCEKNLSVNVAHEDLKYGNYYAGVLRNINKGALLHMDFAKRDAPDWRIDGIQAQIAWNLYIDAESTRGSTFIYNRPWTPVDEVKRKKNEYNYSRDVVDGCERYESKFIIGDLTLFNSRNYHEVQNCNANRYTMSSFIGMTPRNELYLWS